MALSPRGLVRKGRRHSLRLYSIIIKYPYSFLAFMYQRIHQSQYLIAVS